MKKTLVKIAAIAGTTLISLAFALPALAAAPNWDTTGSYGINVNYLSVDYPETLVLSQTGSAITGVSLDTLPPGSYFSVTGGSVSGNAIAIDASQGSLVVHMLGTIAPSGSMSGTWADEAPGTRTGTWASTSGNAVLLGTLSAEDFGVVNYDTGLGILKGYTAGFGVADATFAGATSVVVKLYSAGDVLLQTNTAILPKFNLDVTGTQFSSPFDVSGTFAYATDGYWTNVRETQYGQSVPATKVVATVTLANGKVVTAQNIVLTGDPTTIYPPVVIPPVLTHPTTKDQCKNNGWMTFNDPVFANQGACVSFVESANNNHGNHPCDVHDGHDGSDKGNGRDNKNGHDNKNDNHGSKNDSGGHGSSGQKSH